MSVRHDRAAMTRAVLEGVAFGLKDSMDLIAAAAPIDEIRVSGGGAVSDTWMQIVADVVGRPLHRLGTSEGAAQGAAILAALGVGIVSSVDDAGGIVDVEGIVEPSADSDRYVEGHARYRDLYTALAPTFRTGIDD